MLILLIVLCTSFVFPLDAWAYIDPGFGGYVHSFAFEWGLVVCLLACVVIIFVFRTFIWRKLFAAWLKFKIVLFIILGILMVCLVIFFFSKITKPTHALGVRIIDQQRMAPGYNLYDGKLMDVQGRIVKKWPNYLLGTIDTNGDYYGGKFYEKTWGRYTWEGEPVWEKNFLIHHELYLSPKGTVVTFTTEDHSYNNFNVGFDVILEFDKNGKELQRYSFWEHRKEFQSYKPEFFIDLEFFSTPAQVLSKFLSKSSYDYFHINSFVIIPPNALEGRSPAFRPGNWLISLLHGSMIFILDQDTKRILWHAVSKDIEGELQGQHAVSMLSDGNIILFENGFERKASRVLIIDPITHGIKWQYRDKDFYSEHGGFVQGLTNGNLLITESEKNHVFELTPDQKIVWEYYGPFFEDRTIYRMTRYPTEMIDRFLQKGDLSQ